LVKGRGLGGVLQKGCEWRAARAGEARAARRACAGKGAGVCRERGGGHQASLAALRLGKACEGLGGLAPSRDMGVGRRACRALALYRCLWQVRRSAAGEVRFPRRRGAGPRAEAPHRRGGRPTDKAPGAPVSAATPGAFTPPPSRDARRRGASGPRRRSAGRPAASARAGVRQGVLVGRVRGGPGVGASRSEQHAASFERGNPSPPARVRGWGRRAKPATGTHPEDPHRPLQKAGRAARAAAAAAAASVVVAAGARRGRR
jgi:hypothetical protein